MVYSENLTNRELLKNAMPLKSLTRAQWNTILAYAEELKNMDNDSALRTTIDTLISNQSKIEIMEQYSYYYLNELDNKVCDESIEMLSLY